MHKINTEITLLINKGVNKSISYSEYRELVSQHVSLGTSTGPEQTDALANYTKLNDSRMRRLDKTINIPESIVDSFKNYTSNVTWLVLTESWCGDAAQSMPIMNKLSELSENIVFKVILRDDNVELMNRFLTNGSQSIPKLLMIDNNTKEVIGQWGPRPSIATKMVNEYKKKHGSLTPEFKKELQVWYTIDKGMNIIGDLENLLH